MCDKIRRLKGIGVASFLIVGLNASVEGLAAGMYPLREEHVKR